MPNADGFCSDWASSPGDTIRDAMAERGLSADQFAQTIGQTTKEVSDLLDGRIAVTIGLARRLRDVLGGSVEFWISRDVQFRKDVARLRRLDEEWLRELPVEDMVRFGWLDPAPHPSEEVTACLRFFGTPNVAAWRQTYSQAESRAAFRTSPTLDSRPGSVAAWLRQGEIQAQRLHCASWNKSEFEKSLESIRALTRQKDPLVFIPGLQRICEQCGVALTVVRAPNGCRASGAVRFLAANRPLLQLSARYLSEDQFWFTFFHEAGHLVLHSDKGMFLEGLEEPKTIEEQEANNFAEDVLVPPRLRPSLMSLGPHMKDVVRFARKVGVSPGIVVGQLQFRRRIGRNQLNSLKRRFEWVG